MIQKNKMSLDKLFLVPNVGAIAREMTEKSQIQLIIDRFLSLGLTSKLKLIINNIAYLPDLAKMDFAVGIKILCELEILKALEKGKERHFVLHNQMVDMSLALKNPKVLKYYFSLSKKYNFIPGIVSYNVGPLIKLLSNIMTIPNNLKIYTLINKNGYLMNPLYKDIGESLKIINLNFVNISNE